MKNPAFAFPVSSKDFKVSSYSDPGGIIKTCVEVATTKDGVAVRDSKQPDGAILFFNHQEWAAFLQGAKAGEFG